MDKNLINTLPKVKGFYKQNASLSHYTWFKVGGNADILYKPHDAEDLSFFLKKCNVCLHHRHLLNYKF